MIIIVIGQAENSAWFEGILIPDFKEFQETKQRPTNSCTAGGW